MSETDEEGSVMAITDEQQLATERRWARGGMNSTEAHLMVVAIPGRTAKHLREAHGIEPLDDKGENIALHAEAHGCTVDRDAGLIHWPSAKVPDPS